MNLRPLTQEERTELDSLNVAVTSAVERRRKWLNAKIEECSKLKVGDDIYNLQTGRRLGRITELYRYWGGGGSYEFDDSMNCDYKFETSPNCIDNTSRYGGSLSFGTREEAIERAESMAKRLREENQ